MTPEMQKNIEFLQSSFERVGFGNMYHSALDEGIRASLPSIPFGEAIFDGPNKEEIRFKPTVIEAPDRPGFYVFTGFSATRALEGKPDQTISVAQFKMTGMNLKQAMAVLNGSTVYHTEGQDSNQVNKYYFSKVDFSQPAKDDGTLPMIRVPSKSFDLTALLSKEKVVAKPDEKKDIVIKLEKGDRVTVTSRPEQYTGGQFPRVVLQLDLYPGKNPGTHDLGLNVSDTNGKLLRKHTQEPKVAFENRPTLRLRTAEQPTSAITERAIAAKMANTEGAGGQRSTTRHRRTS